MTNDMAAACTTYLDVLNKQGIVIPDDTTDDDDDDEDVELLSSSRFAKKQKTSHLGARASLRSKAATNHKNFHETIK